MKLKELNLFESSKPKIIIQNDIPDIDECPEKTLWIRPYKGKFFQYLIHRAAGPDKTFRVLNSKWENTYVFNNEKELDEFLLEIKSENNYEVIDKRKNR